MPTSKDDEGQEWKKEAEAIRAELAKLSGQLPNLETAPELKALREQLKEALSGIKALREQAPAENPQATAKITALETTIANLSAQLSELAKSLPPKKPDEPAPADQQALQTKTKRDWI